MIVDGVSGPRAEALTGAGPAATPAPRAAAAKDADGADFRSVLESIERSQLQFSRHAVRRIEQRGLQLDGERVRRLEQAVDRAEAKGSRDSLILLDELALVVSVRNHTVITAVDEASRREQVFTNIDSVVIAE